LHFLAGAKNLKLRQWLAWGVRSLQTLTSRIYSKGTPRSSEHLQMMLLDGFSCLIRHRMWFCARSAFGVRKLNFKLNLNLFIRKIKKNYNGAYGENLKIL